MSMAPPQHLHAPLEPGASGRPHATTPRGRAEPIPGVSCSGCPPCGRPVVGSVRYGRMIAPLVTLSFLIPLAGLVMVPFLVTFVRAAQSEASVVAVEVL